MQHSIQATLKKSRRYLSSFWQSHKTLLLKTSAVLCLILVMGALGERFIFQHTLRQLNPEDQNIRIVNPSRIIHQGFSLNTSGNLISQKENATLTIPTDSRYIENLTIELTDVPQYFLTLSFVDQKTDSTNVLVKDFAKRMEKGNYRFLSSLTFPIKSSPSEIVLTAQKQGTSLGAITIDNTVRFNPHRFAFLVAGQIIFLFLFIFRKRIGVHPEWAFLVIALVSGALFAFSQKPNASWDARIHYKRAIALSFENLLPNKVSDAYTNSESAPPFSTSLKEQELLRDYTNHDYKKTLEKKSSHHQKNNFTFDKLFSWYTHISYLPIGLILFLGRLVQLPLHLIHQFGTFANLFTLVIPIFFAIRILKTGKMILASIALLPTSVFIASNYGYDAWVTSFIALGLALLFTELQSPDRTLTRRNMFIMIGALVIGLGPKAIYFPLLFLLFLLPKTKFPSTKDYQSFLRISIFSLLFVVSSFVIPFLTEQSSYTDRRGGIEVNAAQQAHLILTHPIIYTNTLLVFLRDYLNPLHAEGFMTNFAYLGFTSGFLPLLTLLILVTLIDRNASDRNTSTLTVKLWVIGILLATVSLFATSLYISYTPVGLGTINGVQPRYLLPLLFPFLFVIGPSRSLILKKPTHVYPLIFGVLALILLWGIWDCIISLYH